MVNKQRDNNTQTRDSDSRDIEKPHKKPNKNGEPKTISNNTSNRGFASKDEDKKHEIQSKGGHASAEKAGHEGMSERGRKGGESSHGEKNGI